MLNLSVNFFITLNISRNSHGPIYVDPDPKLSVQPDPVQQIVSNSQHWLYVNYILAEAKISKEMMMQPITKRQEWQQEEKPEK